jgi:hypothetical protein
MIPLLQPPAVRQARQIDGQQQHGAPLAQLPGDEPLTGAVGPAAHGVVDDQGQPSIQPRDLGSQGGIAGRRSRRRGRRAHASVSVSRSRTRPPRRWARARRARRTGAGVAPVQGHRHPSRPRRGAPSDAIAMVARRHRAQSGSHLHPRSAANRAGTSRWLAHRRASDGAPRHRPAAAGTGHATPGHRHRTRAQCPRADARDGCTSPRPRSGPCGSAGGRWRIAVEPLQRAGDDLTKENDTVGKSASTRWSGAYQKSDLETLPRRIPEQLAIVTAIERLRQACGQLDA